MEDNDIIISKNEVLKSYIGFYCKNEILISTDHDYKNLTIELPAKNGNMIKYIVDICNENNTFNCVINCTNDSQCLSNKCVNNIGMLNDNNSIVHCDVIYNCNIIIDCGSCSCMVVVVVIIINLSVIVVIIVAVAIVAIVVVTVVIVMVITIMIIVVIVVVVVVL